MNRTTSKFTFSVWCMFWNETSKYYRDMFTTGGPLPRLTNPIIKPCRKSAGFWLCFVCCTLNLLINCHSLVANVQDFISWELWSVFWWRNNSRVVQLSVEPNPNTLAFHLLPCKHYYFFWGIQILLDSCVLFPTKLTLFSVFASFFSASLPFCLCTGPGVCSAE